MIGNLPSSSLKLLIFGSVVYILFLSGRPCECAKKSAKNSKSRPIVSRGRDAFQRVKLGNHTADVTIVFKTDEDLKNDFKKQSTAEDKDMLERLKRKRKWQQMKEKYGYGYGYDYGALTSGTSGLSKDDFDDETGFYADDYYGKGSKKGKKKGGGGWSNQYHYSGATYEEGSHGGHGHDHLDDHYADGPVYSKGAETSFSLISFITFASFLLFVLNPLLSLPKRARLEHMYHEKIKHSTHGVPVPVPVHSSGGWHESSDPGGYQPGPPPWFGPEGHGGSGHSHGHTEVHDSGWSPSYGGSFDESGWKPGALPSHYGGGDGTHDQAMSYGPAPPVPKMMKPQMQMITKAKSSKKKRMKGAASETSSVKKKPEPPDSASSKSTSGGDDSLLSKDEILQILKNLDTPGADSSTILDTLRVFDQDNEYSMGPV